MPFDRNISHARIDSDPLKFIMESIATSVYNTRYHFLMLEPLLVRLVQWMEWRDKRYAGTMHEI